MRINILHCFFVLVIFLSLFSCKEDILKGNYKDDYSTLYTFLEENEDYSSFKSIVDAAIIDGTDQSMKDIYKAFNHSSPEGTNRGYTLFLPDNAAVEAYLKEENISLNSLLTNSKVCWNLATHHLLVSKILKKNFVNGALGDSSLNGSYHVIRFVSTGTEVGYLVDELATVQVADIVESNGVIHLIDKVLRPLTLTSCEWLNQSPQYSIFVEALKLTGLYDTLQSINTRINPFTMFVESNDVFAKKSISSLEDLKKYISPTNINYTDEGNPLYQFLAYHILPQRVSYSDLTQSSSSASDGSSEVNRTTVLPYNTKAYYPLQITINEKLSLRDNLLEQVGINTGLGVYETITSSGSAGNTTIVIDHISIFEDISNMPTLSGVMHFINYVMTVNSSIKPATRYFHFREDPNINYYYQKIANKSYGFYEKDLERFKFEGDLDYIRYLWSDVANGATNNDYIYFSGGSFTMTFRTSQVMQGNYTLQFKLKVDESSGFFDVYVDGLKIGNTINIASKEPNTSGYNTFTLGNVFLSGYKEHDVSIKSVTPCKIYWDFLQFIPF